MPSGYCSVANPGYRRSNRCIRFLRRRSACRRPRRTGGLVQHNVGDDVNADGIALLDHVFEFGFRAELGIELVAYRLVGRPPLRALDGFLRRRHLDVCHAFRTVCARAFLGDRVPCLLEGDDLHVFLRIRLRLGLSLSHMRYRHQGGARHGGGDAYGHRTASRPIHSLNDHCSPFSSLRSNSGPHAGSALRQRMRHGHPRYLRII